MNCRYQIEPESLPRQANALRIEVMSPSVRCTLRLPEHWSPGAKKLGALRWIGSGGSPMVLGVCQLSVCPLRKDKDQSNA